MERETKEIVTPLGQNKIVIKAWLTGRERRAIRSVLLEGVSFSATSNEEENATPDYNFQGSALDKMQDKALETVVVSVDGKTENVLDILLDELKEQDFEFVLAEIDKVTGGLSEEDKKK